MKRKTLVVILAIMMLLATVLSACADTSKSADPTTANNTAAPTDAAKETPASTGEETAAELRYEDIEFPDFLPSAIVMAQDGLYDYDDLTERYAIEIMLTNYGEQPFPAEQDPINQWLSNQFNMDLSLTAPAGADYITTLSARFAANDVPDLLMLPTANRNEAFTFSDQGLLVDARNVYPYLKHSNLYTTKNMVAWSTNPNNNEIPFVTKYAIQDGVWGLAIRADWLKALDMDYPTTREELMAYAMACTFNDPDGNGQNDTYFMTANGNGTAWGMLGAFESMFGNPSAYADNGQLSHPYFNNVRKEYLTLLKDFYDAGVLAPDWFTLEWEQGRALVGNDKVGMVWWPVGALYQQYAGEDHKGDMDALNVWDYWVEAPIEGGKYGSNGNPGFLWCFPAAKYDAGNGELNTAKIKRVAHMMDTMTIGNINYFQTVQGSIDEVFEAAGMTIEKPRIMEYTENGTFFVNNPGTAPYTTDSGRRSYEIWQQFGLCVSYQVDYADPDDEYVAKMAERTAKFYQTVHMDYPRWENTGLLVTLSGEAAEAQATNTDWIVAQEYAFVTGSRDLNDYDAFAREWLNKGGKAIVTQTAEQLGVPVPDYAK